MGSSSSSNPVTTSNNLALDQRDTNGSGIQILDSIIVDASDQVMLETMANHRASFEVMMSNSTLQLTDVLDLGKEVMRLADNEQIRMNEAAYYQLDQGVRMLEGSRKQGKYVIDLVDTAAKLTFDLAKDVTGGNDDRLEQALDLVADVKTEGYAQTLETMSTLVVIFGLGALYLTTRK